MQPFVKMDSSHLLFSCRERQRPEPVTCRLSPPCFPRGLPPRAEQSSVGNEGSWRKAPRTDGQTELSGRSTSTGLGLCPSLDSLHFITCLSKGSLTVIFNFFCQSLHRFQDQHTPQPVSGERGAGWEVGGKEDVPQREKLGEEDSASSESAEGREGASQIVCPSPWETSSRKQSLHKWSQASRLFLILTPSGGSGST